MSEGQSLSDYLKGLSMNIIMFKFYENPLKKVKVTANISKNKQNFDF
jgi:hypothetical protein